MKLGEALWLDKALKTDPTQGRGESTLLVVKRGQTTPRGSIKIEPAFPPGEHACLTNSLHMPSSNELLDGIQVDLIPDDLSFLTDREKGTNTPPHTPHTHPTPMKQAWSKPSLRTLLHPYVERHHLCTEPRLNAERGCPSHVCHA